ncbi:MAG: hypothetical protein AAFV53_38575 [Myxococcota bacterium]
MGIRTRIKNRLKRILGQTPEPAPSPHPMPSREPVVSKPSAPARRVPKPAETAPEPSPEEKEKQEKAARHFERARKGVLKFVSKKPDGVASLAEMHEHSEMRYFIGHQRFSKLMEGLVGEGLVDFDSTQGTATLTSAGRQYIAR